MRLTYVSLALSAGVALGLTFGAAARAEPAARQVDPAAQGVSTSEASPPAEQARLAEVTLKLEQALNDQFARGTIDRNALSGPVDEVLQAMPEAARPKVQLHIAQVLLGAEKLASMMDPGDRAQAVASPALETIDKTRQAQIAAWGWPGAVGWGGLGAFGFPAMGTFGFPGAFRFGGGYSCSFSSQTVNGLGYSSGGCVPFAF
jgi:hypothetical protein